MKSRRSVSFDKTMNRTMEEKPALPDLDQFRQFRHMPRVATPVPPAGLNFVDDEEQYQDYIMDDDDEDFEMRRNSLLDLTNAPPLSSADYQEMELSNNGEKRKTTPPDLLTLSHMYFERNQVRFLISFVCKKYHIVFIQKTMRSESFDRPTTGTSFQPSRNLESSSSTRSVPGSFTMMHDFALDRHNLGVHRPRKLTPLERLPKTSQVRIDDSDRNNERLLHLSVHYNPGSGWKQTLDPISVAPSVNERNRKETYNISKLPKFQ